MKKSTKDLYSNRYKPFKAPPLSTTAKKRLDRKLRSDIDVEIKELTTFHEEEDAAWLSEKLWLDRQAFATAVLGGLLAVAGTLGLLFPAVGIPFAVVILGGCVGELLPLVGFFILNNKIKHERNHLADITEDVEENSQDDANNLALIFPSLSPTPQQNTLAIIDANLAKEVKHTAQIVHSTSSPLPHIRDGQSTQAYLMTIGIMSPTDLKKNSSDPWANTGAKRSSLPIDDSDDDDEDTDSIRPRTPEST